VDGLEADRSLIGQTSRPEQVSAILRSRISDGYFAPGARLVEDEITRQLKISRNTLREAFRLLTHERLLEQELNRGTFVRVPGVADVRDLYRVRKHIECSAVRTVTATPAALSNLTDTVTLGRRALDAHDSRALGSANILFHQALVELAGSPRLDELMRGVLAELRLVFHVMEDLRWFHEPYVGRNQEIVDLLADGDGDTAAKVLQAYLDDAEWQLVEAYTVHRK